MPYFHFPHKTVINDGNLGSAGELFSVRLAQFAVVAYFGTEHSGVIINQATSDMSEFKKTLARITSTVAKKDKAQALRGAALQAFGAVILLSNTGDRTDRLKEV